MSLTTEQVWEAFHAPLLQFIRRRVSDEVTAEDVLQDVFLKIHRHVETLQDVRKLESWIYQIARHTIIDSYRELRLTTTLGVQEVLDVPEELPDDDIVGELFRACERWSTVFPLRTDKHWSSLSIRGSRKKNWENDWVSPFLGRNHGFSGREKNSSSCCWRAAILNWTAVVIF